jgi:hypothetical protein
MTLVVYVFLGYMLVVIVLKLALQRRWARQLYRQHDARYSYGFIFRKIGRSHYGRFVRQHKEGLDPAFLGDLQDVQHRSFVWNLALAAIWSAVFFTWLILKTLGW